MPVQTMEPQPRTSYDAVPYESKAFTETHPDRLATIATLFGMRPAPVERCRVLELGCADGANLIPMAVGLPQANFVGIDLSARQVSDGQAVISALGLKNIELRAASILEIDESAGVFDYIVCHGVYSWVPPEVQEHILRICRRNLAPAGVAYVSYNTYPGWHVRQMVREILCYHARRVAEPLEQVRQARAFIEFLGQAVVVDPTSTYGSTIRGAVEALRQRSDSYLLHEYLEEYNEPLYFHQFAERSRKHGLQYLGDAHISTMMMTKLAPEVQETLRRLATNLIELEQYLDFVQNRPFRRSLLCHEGIALNHTLRPESLASLAVSSLAKPVGAQVNLNSDEPLEYRTPEGASLTTREPLVKAAMWHLAEVCPRAVPFERLWTIARERTAAATVVPTAESAAERNANFLGGRLLNYFVSGIVQLHANNFAFASTVSVRPAGSPFARHQARLGRRVTNLRHELIELSELGRQVLILLDGTRTRGQLFHALAELIATHALRLEHNGQPILDPHAVREQLEAALDQTLTLLARSACLIE